jgi:hypothetical protein
MNFGGPVWHASGRGTHGDGRQIALAALEGVGDERLGQWEEKGRGGVWHVRRRLSDEEQRVVGDALDVRGTPEEEARLHALLKAVAPELRLQIINMRLGRGGR